MMKLSPIIVSLLDTDLYKFNMNQIMFHKHTNLMGEYHFKCRNKDVTFTDEMVNEIKEQVDHMCSLTFTNEELEYLRTIRFLKNDYIEFLRLYRPLRDYVEISKNENGELSVIIRGPLFSAMQFEIYLLEIINEVYFRMIGGVTLNSYMNQIFCAMDKLEKKIDSFNDGIYTFKFAEFGCRRRLSREFQEYALFNLLNRTKGACIGTSNVYFAKKFGCKPIGTYAHEFVQMYQGIKDIPKAMTNKVALEEWFEEYQGDNGTALTDTLGTDVFLLDFNKLQASCYSGVRHDSGDPYKWGDKMIAHYEKLNINPMDKTLLFSDSLTFTKAQEIHNYFSNRINTSFGIGTFITNDALVEPLNIVIKLQYVNGNPVAKLSDNIEKAMCADPSYIQYLNGVCKYRLNEENK